MCDRAIEKYLHPLRFILDHLKTQEMCEKAVEKSPYQLGDFPDRFKTQEICIKAVEDKTKTLKYILIILRSKKFATRQWA